MKIKHIFNFLSLKHWAFLFLAVYRLFSPVYAMEIPQADRFKNRLITTLLQNYRAPLLIGAGSLAVAGALGAAYWYFKKPATSAQPTQPAKPSIEAIKADIRQKTNPFILKQLENAKQGKNVNVTLGSPHANGGSFGPDAAQDEYFIEIWALHNPGTSGVTGILIFYTFACDKSQETKTINF